MKDLSLNAVSQNFEMAYKRRLQIEQRVATGSMRDKLTTGPLSRKLVSLGVRATEGVAISTPIDSSVHRCHHA